MRIFKNTWFDRFAKKEGLRDADLRALVPELEQGNWEADLGAGVYKKRIARPGEGKRGGYRVIVFFRSGERIFFAYGFAKNVRGNISDKEERALRANANANLGFTDEELDVRVKNGLWIEITDEKVPQ